MWESIGGAWELLAPYQNYVGLAAVLPLSAVLYALWKNFKAPAGTPQHAAPAQHGHGGNVAPPQQGHAPDNAPPAPAQQGQGGHGQAPAPAQAQPQDHTPGNVPAVSKWWAMTPISVLLTLLLGGVFVGSKFTTSKTLTTTSSKNWSTSELVKTWKEFLEMLAQSEAKKKVGFSPMIGPEEFSYTIPEKMLEKIYLDKENIEDVYKKTIPEELEERGLPRKVEVTKIRKITCYASIKTGLWTRTDIECDLHFPLRPGVKDPTTGKQTVTELPPDSQFSVPIQMNLEPMSNNLMGNHLAQWMSRLSPSNSVNNNALALPGTGRTVPAVPAPPYIGGKEKK